MATTTVTTAVASADTTSICLQPLPAPSQRRDAAKTTAPRVRDADPTLEASREADLAVPDGGKQAWLVVLGCSVITWWFSGTAYAWGIMQDALVEAGVGGPSTLAFVGSLSMSLIAWFAVANARLLRSMGSQRMGILGITCLGVGELLSGWTVESLGGLFVTAGVLTGVGMGFCFMSVSVTPAQYFSKKRGMANACVFAAGGLGGAVTALALSAIITRVGPAWGFRTLGLTTLATGLPAAWLVKERAPIRGGAIVEWRLFRSLTFLCIFLAGAIGIFALFVPPFFLPLYTRSLGFPTSTGASLVAGFNFASFAGRLGIGVLSDRIGAVTSLCLSFTLCGLSLLAIWPAAGSSLGALSAFVVINGASNGGFFAVMPTVVGNTFGSARVSVAMGMVVTGWGGGYLMGSPIAGYLLDAYGGEDGGLKAYRPAMFFAGSMALGAALMAAIARVHLQKSWLSKV